MPESKPTPLGTAEVVRAVPTSGGAPAVVVRAAEWSNLTADEKARVDVSALFKLAGAYFLRGRARLVAIHRLAREYGAMGHLEDYRDLTHQWMTPNRDAARQTGSARVSAAPRMVHIRAEKIEAWNEAIGELRVVCMLLDQLGIISLNDVTEFEEQIPYIKHLHKLSQAGRDTSLDKLSYTEKTEILMAELRWRVAAGLRRQAWEPILVGGAFSMRIEWHPTTLRGALWQQVIRLIERAEPTNYKKCAECHKVLVFTGSRESGRRADAVHCSQECAQRAYRKRQARARELHAKGWDVERIVTELNVEKHRGRSARQVVNGWLKPRKRKDR